MNERTLTRVLIGVALLFALGPFYLLIAIDRHRQLFEEQTLGSHHITMQATEQATALALRVQNLSLDNAGGDGTWRSLAGYIGPLRNSIRRIDREFHADVAEHNTIMLRVRELLEDIRSRMYLQASATDAQLRALGRSSNELVLSLNALARSQYRQMAQEQALITERLDSLTRTARVMAFAIASFGTVLALMLLRADRRVLSVYEEARFNQEQLGKAVEELSSGDNERRAQNRFIAAASHDLRQPLHALGLYLTALSRHVHTADGRAILTSAHRSNEALNQLLNSLLDISRLDAGVVDIEERPFALAELFEQLQQTFKPDADERGLLLDVQATGLWIETDRVLLDRILRNLISNALNYTVEGSVQVRARRSGESVVLTVSDTGLGIPPLEQQSVFNEYYQLHNPERDRGKGLGLGLSIVRRLTRLLDLTLTVDSTEGKGTTFEILVPLGHRSDALAIQQENALVTINSSDTHCVEGLTILVIDDEKDILDGMYSLLTSCGSRVITADSADQATDKLVESEIVPDLIIVDFRLRDEQTGDHAIERVREEINEDVPAMIITGDTSPDRLKEATASGFKLLHKPVGSEELFASIRQLVEV